MRARLAFSQEYILTLNAHHHTPEGRVAVDNSYCAGRGNDDDDDDDVSTQPLLLSGLFSNISIKSLVA